MKKLRPLSPHLSVHRWIFSQIMSILHRGTAIGYSIGLLFISLWLISISLGPIYFAFFNLIFENLLGKIIIFIISFCFSFYFIDELRKLFWAFGLGMDLTTIRFTGYVVIFLSLIISVSILIKLI